ncbi:unnamed protein product [Blepharisma stoltei]|uniref:Centrosomal protein of 70 kDa n=1 Tax=Blepharisma stoltei TaxID=1481888 RepID=A0AAU9K445_9CILI|nr:unnamed protein product [Blepharisma stoltei]
MLAFKLLYYKETNCILLHKNLHNMDLDFKILKQSPLSSWDSESTTKVARTFDLRKRSTSEKALKTAEATAKDNRRDKRYGFQRDTFTSSIASEFTTSMNDFLKSSAELQSEFHRLSDASRNATSRKSNPSLNIVNRNFYPSISEGSIESPRYPIKDDLRIIQPSNLASKISSPRMEGGYDSVAEKLLTVLAEPKRPSPVPKLNQVCNSARNSTPVQYKDDGVLPTPRTTVKMWEQAKLSHEEEIFGSFLKRNFDSNSEEDVLILGIIFMYEEQKKILQREIRRHQNELVNKEPSSCEAHEKKIKRLENQNQDLKQENMRLKYDLTQHKDESRSLETTLTQSKEKDILQKLTDILETGAEHLPEQAAKLKSQIKNAELVTYSIMRMANELSLHGDPNELSSVIEEIQCFVYSLQNEHKEIEKFVHEISKTLNVSQDLNQILNACRAVPYMKKLFNFQDDLITSIDSLFLRTHEIQSFSQFMKRKLKMHPSASLSEVLEKLRDCVH